MHTEEKSGYKEEEDDFEEEGAVGVETKELRPI